MGEGLRHAFRFGFFPLVMFGSLAVAIALLQRGVHPVGALLAGQLPAFALVIGFDRSKKPNFSVKALQIAEEKQAVAQYGSSDSGASLGDILGEALKAKSEG